MSKNNQPVDSSSSDNSGAEAKTVIHPRSIEDKVRNAIRIAFLIFLWPVVVMGFVGLGAAYYAGTGHPVSSQIGKLGFYAVVGTGTICALHAKKSKSIWFFGGALGAFMAAFVEAFLIAIFK